MADILGKSDAAFNFDYNFNKLKPIQPASLGFSNNYFDAPQLTQPQTVNSLTQSSTGEQAVKTSNSFDGPKLYSPKSFDLEAKFREMYGTQASKRDRRRFNKWANSEERWAQQDAFEREEFDKQMASWDARQAALKEWAKNYSSDQTIQNATPAQNTTPVQNPTLAPAAKSAFNESHWVNRASAAGFKNIDEVRNFQKEYNQFYKNKAGFIPLKEDGLFGDKSEKALLQLTKDKGIEAEQKAQAVLNDPFAWAKSQGLKGYTANGRDYYYHPKFGRIFADGKVYNPNTKQLGKFNAGEVTWNQKQFNLDNFSRRFGDGTLIRRNNKRFFRYDPDGAGDYLVGEDGKIYEAGVHGVPGEIAADAATSRARRVLKDLQNKIQTSYMQQGGKMNNQEEMQKAFMAFLIQDAAEQGMQIQSEQDLQAYAEQLGEEGIKAKYQEFMQKMQGQTPAAKYGAKLNYLKQLRGECPEGYEVTYFKEGGMFRKGCKVCEAKKAMMEKGGTTPKNAVEKFKQRSKAKMPTTYNGKKYKDQIEQNACGSKLKKRVD